MSNPRVLADYLLTIPTRLGGINKDTADQASDWAVRDFAPVDSKGFPAMDARNGPTQIEPDLWYVSLDAVFLWCDAGAEIENYQGAYHELADPDKVCPYWEAIDPPVPGDDPQTWQEWGLGAGGSHAPIQIGAFWYRSMYEGSQGQPINARRWYDYTRAPLTNSTGIQRIISVWEFQEIQAAAGP